MNIPITYSFKTIDTQHKQWNEFIEIIYILSGKLTVQVNQQIYHLTQDQLILINKFDMHALDADSCKVASFRLHLSAFKDPLIHEIPMRFDCNSITTTDESELISIKNLLARIVKNNLVQDQNQQFLMHSYAYSLLYELLNHFHINQHTEANNNFSLRRIEKIVDYLNKNYAQPITLEKLAEEFYISPPYLSKMFKESMDMGFKDYLDSIRLSNAVSDLANLSWSLDFIADKNGFSSARSFTHIFKKKYHVLPSNYRADPKSEISLNQDSFNKSYEEDLTFKHHKDLRILAKYLDYTHQPQDRKPAPITMKEITPISANQKGFPLRHTFKNTTTIGNAKQLLYAQNQSMLKILQQDIGFRYIKFHGIFDDDMMVYSENSLGEPEVDFTYVDMSIDFLLSINIKPFLELSFMPKKLAKSAHRKIFFSESIISMPKDDDKWVLLIKQFIRHLINRYGKEEVTSWFFFLWNMPDSPESMFGFSDANEFFYFYKITYQAIKTLDLDLQFGTPSLMGNTIPDDCWFKDFIEYCQQNQCLPDFINYNFYPVGKGNKLNSDTILHSNIVLDSNENALKDNFYNVKRIIRNYGLFENPIYITEWNSTISQRDLLNDTAFKATYIVKNILENYDHIDSFGYWTLSDITNEVKVPEKLFHGGMGLFTFNGIKKPAYYAFILLNKLGNTLIGRGDGYFITKHHSNYQIILYNYQHFSSLYASGELFDMAFTKRYTPFPKPSIKKFVIPLSELPISSYIVTDTILNQDHGSPFDKWVEMGAIELKTQEEIDYLKSISVPRITKQQLDVTNSFLAITRELKPHEVRFIEICPTM